MSKLEGLFEELRKFIEEVLKNLNIKLQSELDEDLRKHNGITKIEGKLNYVRPNTIEDIQDENLLTKYFLADRAKEKVANQLDFNVNKDYIQNYKDDLRS